jgi:hypothetical protein
MRTRFTRALIVAASAGALAVTGIAITEGTPATSSQVSAWPDPDDPAWDNLEGSAEIGEHAGDDGG